MAMQTSRQTRKPPMIQNGARASALETIAVIAIAAMLSQAPMPANL
jgi:hypothetical protein